jgi:hypothetical protein
LRAEKELKGIVDFGRVRFNAARDQLVAEGKAEVVALVDDDGKIMRGKPKGIKRLQ